MPTYFNSASLFPVRRALVYNMEGGNVPHTVSTDDRRREKSRVVG